MNELRIFEFFGKEFDLDYEIKFEVEEEKEEEEGVPLLNLKSLNECFKKDNASN